MSSRSAFWRHSDGALPNSLAFAYLVLSHLLGLALLASNQPLAWLAGVVLLAHSLVIGGYLIHDLAHLCIFRSRRVTTIVGELVSWLCGSAYAPFRRIQKMHMRHHGDRADLALFDPRPLLRKHPFLRRSVYAAEWLYLPAVELIMHYQVLLRPFLDLRYAADRPRVLLVGASRGLFFFGLFLLSPWALAGYALAYMLFLTALFLADAFAHTYEFYLIDSVGQAVPKDGRNAAYDRAHTFSNLVSERWPWLNLLNLNFGYHNAHHDQPSVPWYRLPAFHRERYDSDTPQILPYRELWAAIHRNRLKRIVAEDAGCVGSGPGRADDFLGVHGVSFLSIV